MTMTANKWLDVLKQKLAGRFVVTCEMGVYFWSVIRCTELQGPWLLIYPEAWFRLYDKYEPWKTEVGDQQPLRVRIEGENAMTPDINSDTGEIYFCIPFKGEVWIRHHDCVLQSGDDPSFSEDGVATSELVYTEDHKWVIRTTAELLGSETPQSFDLRVKFCPRCGQELPSFK